MLLWKYYPILAWEYSLIIPDRANVYFCDCIIPYFPDFISYTSLTILSYTSFYVFFSTSLTSPRIPYSVGRMAYRNLLRKYFVKQTRNWKIIWTWILGEVVVKFKLQIAYCESCPFLDFWYYCCSGSVTAEFVSSSDNVINAWQWWIQCIRKSATANSRNNLIGSWRRGQHIVSRRNSHHFGSVTLGRMLISIN